MMKVFSMANVKNAGDYYEVISITTNQGQYVEQGTMFLNMASYAAEVADGEIKKGNKVFVPKNLENEITVSDLIINAPDEIEKKKISLLYRARNIVTQAAATLRAFDFFEFTMCNNFLSSRGFFITNDNREEVYIDIINSGDETVIEYLEKYLNLLDRISVPNYQYNVYLQFEESVLSAKSLTELEELEKGYRYF